MTSAHPQAPIENVPRGFLLSLLVVPLGIVVLVALSLVGVTASIVGFGVAYGAMALYRLGSGGIISRTGAWVITGVLAATLLIGIWAALVVAYAGGVNELGLLNAPEFWNSFSANFGNILSKDSFFILLVLAFGALGAFRTLRRAFQTSRVVAAPNTTVGSYDGPPVSTTTAYQNDIDVAPTGSADDKTPPPTSGS